MAERVTLSRETISASGVMHAAFTSARVETQTLMTHDILVALVADVLAHDHREVTVTARVRAVTSVRGALAVHWCAPVLERLYIWTGARPLARTADFLRDRYESVVSDTRTERVAQRVCPHLVIDKQRTHYEWLIHP